MTTLKDRIAEDMRDAMRAGEKVRLAALRMLLTGVVNREKELRREATDQEVQEVAAREVKRRKEAAEAYEQAGRTDLLERERQEQAVLEAYAPTALSEDEVRALVDEAVAATGASGPGDMGKVMGFVMGKAKGQVDGAEVSRLVKERLAGGG